MRIYATNKQRKRPAARRYPAANPLLTHADHRTRIRHALRGTRLQAKLIVGAPHDAGEQEADRVADAVMRMPEPGRETIAGAERVEPTRVQRLCQECDDEVHRQPAANEQDEMLQGYGMAGPVPAIDAGLEASIQAIRSGGSNLSQPVRSFFEPRFGHDFSHVRIHTSDRAAEAARAVGARAFTVGRDIVFGNGRFEPNSHEGQRLLAHELTHTIQQGAPEGAPETAARPLSPGVLQRQSTPTPAADCSGYESDAESFAWSVARHYMRTETGQVPETGDIQCSGNRKICWVDFVGGIRVAVSFIRVPDFVIARRTGFNMPRREYSYTCTHDGRVILTPLQSGGGP